MNRIDMGWPHSVAAGRNSSVASQCFPRHEAQGSNGVAPGRTNLRERRVSATSLLLRIDVPLRRFYLRDESYLQPRI